MMNSFKATTLILILLVQLSYGYSQGKLELRIYDTLGNPIPYTSVIWNKNSGLVTNLDGYLLIPDKGKIDSLIITSIGFKKQVIGAKESFKSDKLNIVLTKDEIDLPEIIIAKYNVEKEYGYIEKKRESSYIKNAICSNLQAALLINSYNYPAQCKSISVFIVKQSSVDIPYRFHFYEIGNDSLPGRDLFSENLIVGSYKTNSWNTCDLDSIAVQLPKNGFFVAIEWLCTDIKSENGLSIGLTNKMKESATFYKYGNVGWQQMRYKMINNIMLKVKIASAK